ncbi:unnamed protein product, partial [Prorocentrum cordatum]
MGNISGLNVADVMGGKKEPTETQKRAGRPSTMGDQLGDTQQQWTCAATGTAVPQGLTRTERAGAALTGATIFWPSKLADEFGRIMINRRFWPTNRSRRVRVIPAQYSHYRHMPINAERGSNGHGRRWVCGLRAARVAYQEIMPDTSNPKRKLT